MEINKNRALNDRIIGLDVLRIITMSLITLRHFMNYSELISTVGFSSFNGIIIHLLEPLCSCAVNVFVLISGYFLVNSQFKKTKMFYIWGETFFYSLACLLGSLLFGTTSLSAGKLLISVFPIITRHYWFPVAYLALYALAPYLNKLIGTMTQKEHRLLIVGGALLLSLWTTIMYFCDGVMTGGNTGLLWFIYLYLVGAYIRNFVKKLSPTTYGLGVAILVCFLAAYSYIEEKITILQNFPVMNSDSVFILMLSICFFMLFLSMNIENRMTKKIIMLLSGCSFGVYLIQESCMIRQWLWQDVVRPQLLADKWYMIFVAIATVVVLFIIAFVGTMIYKPIYRTIGGIMEKVKNNATKKE